MRLLWLLFWIALVVAILWPMLRRRLPRVRRAPGTADELVKDPVCQTYVVRSRALPGSPAGGGVYFCSADCAKRYAGPTGGRG